MINMIKVKNAICTFASLSRAKRVLFVALILISLVLRFINIDNPIVERHGFRQTQTALTVRVWINEGINIIKYQTPVLGEPWTLPFEFPLYQLFAYGMHKLLNIFSVSNLDIAMRLTNIIFFYGCALFLYLISFQFFEKRDVARCIVIFFILTPYSIFWSRTSMIEFTATFFGLAYIYFILRFLQEQKLKNIVPSIIVGTAAYLAKSTSMIPCCLFLVFVILRFMFTQKYLSMAAIFSKQTIIFCLKMFFIVIIPFTVGYIWVKWADHVKDISGFAALNSANLHAWNFGTIQQKLKLASWRGIYGHLKGIAPPAFFAIFALSLPVLLRNQKKLFQTIIPMISAVFTISIIFNLYYVHDYYFCAVLPFVCMSLVSSCYYITKYLQVNYIHSRDRTVFSILLSVIFLVSVLYNGRDYTNGVLSGKNVFAGYNNSIFELTGYIQNNTNKNDLIVIFDNDWSSDITYYANRKSLAQHSRFGNYTLQEISKCELFIMHHNSVELENRKAFLPPIIFEASAGGWDVYRKDGSP
jgi:hypothetical protein